MEGVGEGGRGRKKGNVGGRRGSEGDGERRESGGMGEGEGRGEEW